MGKDLAETMEIRLASHLESDGIKTTLISPGVASSDGLNHIEIKKTDFPGLKTLSAARNVGNYLKSNDDIVSDADLVLVDWRYVRPLSKQLKKLPTNWAIIDRGPPASSGTRGGRIQRELLRNLQKLYWKGAWRIAANFSSGGFVVSSEHKKLVNSVTGGGLVLSVLPSGAEPNQLLREKTNPSIHLNLAYIGRIDKKRGLGDIFSLSEVLGDKGVSHSIVMVGDGDMAKEFSIRSEKDPHFSFLGKLKQNEIQRVLANQHVGIMPMPDIAVWRISSPIKLAEYAASGLAIIGPSHPGNKLGVGGEWNLLSEDENWVQSCAGKLVDKIEVGNWSENIVEGAVQASRAYHWDVIAKRMIGEMEKMVQQS